MPSFVIVSVYTNDETPRPPWIEVTSTTFLFVVVALAISPVFVLTVVSCSCLI
jgi:hypothetical protein